MASITVDQIQLFVVVFVRVASMVAVMPIFGSGYVPTQVKAAFALILSVILFPLVAAHGPIETPFAWGVFAFAVVKEICVGLLFGFVASMLFAGIQFAGRIIDMEMGFAFSQMVDPLTETEVTTMGQLKMLVFTIFFLLINGHYFMLLGIQKSIEVVPLMGMRYPGGELAFLITSSTSGIFVAGILLAAPAFTALFMSSLGMALIARTVPQINIFFVGLPLKIVLGLITTIIALPTLAEIFRKMTDTLIQDMWRLLYLMA